MDELGRQSGPTRRQRRVGDQIQVEIANILEKQIQDPRLAGLSVTAVKISADLRQATVYVSALPGPSSHQQILLSLDHARSFVRRQLAERLRLRVMPQLSFQWDNSLETGDRISRLLDSLHLNNQDASHGQDVAP